MTLRRAASTTDEAATSVFGHVFRRCVRVHAGAVSQAVGVVDRGLLQPGRQLRAEFRHK